MLKKLFFVAVLAVAAATVTQAADMDKLPNPMLKAKVGQWVSYKMMGGMEMKQTITAIDGSGDAQTITIKSETMVPGQPAQAQEQKIAMKDAKEMQANAWKEAGEVKISEGTVAVKGKDVPAVIVEFTKDGMTSKIFMSDAIPVSPIVKMEIGGMPGPMMELADFGE